MTQEYWNKQHSDFYAKSDWINKPSLFSQLAISYFPETGKVLEIGTGQGNDANFFQSLGYEVVATDFSIEALHHAKDRVKNVKFVNVDTAAGLPFDDNSFDVVYSHMALHYFDEKTTQKVFRDIYRVLKDGAIFAIITNTIEDPEIKEEGYVELETGFYKDPKGIDKRYFSVKSIEEFTRDLFEPLFIDDKGETYKDSIKTLIRFIGKKG